MPGPIVTKSNRSDLRADRFSSSIRVFLSSTFRDMQAERGALLAQTFPGLRQLCAGAGLGFQEVDLRWGVTAEEAEAGDVLRICLDEIDACRPHFLAIIGGRYGWIDPQAKQRLAGSFPHLSEYAGRSVTEIEIRHALLNRPKGALGCTPLIYVRQDALSGSPDEIELRRLLGDLAAAGIPLRPYVSPDDLAVQAASDLAAIIRTAVEAAPRRQTAIDQQAYETMLLASGFQRPKVLAELAAAARRQKNVVVTGPSGQGKSTALAVLARTEERRRAASEALPHGPGPLSWIGGLLSRRWNSAGGPMLFVSLAALSGSWHELSRELCSLAGIEPTPDPVTDFDRLLSEFEGTIVIDDLDAAEDALFAQAQAWLRNPERNTRLVVSTSDPALASALADLQFSWFEMPSVAPVDGLAMVESTLGSFGKKLDDRQKKMVAEAALKAPSLLRIVCEEMRHLGLFEQTDATLADLLSLKDERQALETILARLETGQQQPDLISRVLRLLSAARVGLTERELQMILGIADEPLPMMRLSAVLLPLRPYLLDRRGILSVAFPALRDAIDVRYGDGADASHERAALIEHFLADRLSNRAIDELPWLIAMNRDASAAQVLAPDIAWLEAAMCRDAVACRTFLRNLQRFDGAIRSSAVAAAADAIGDATRNDAAVAVTLQIAMALGAANAVVGPAMTRASRSDCVAMLDALADCLMAAGRLPDALAMLHRVRALLEGSGDYFRQTGVIERAGAVAQKMGDAEVALALFKDAVASHRDRGDGWAATRASANVGTALLELGRYREAGALFTEVEAEARRRHDFDATALAIGGKGITQRFSGKPRKARELLAEEGRRWRLSGNSGRLASSLVNQARCCIDLDDFDGADELLETARVEAASVGERDISVAAIELQIEILQRLQLGGGARAAKLAAERDALMAPGDAAATPR